MLFRSSHLAERLLGDGSYERLPAAPAVDTDANLLPRIHAGQAEAVAPATPGRERWMLTQPFAEGVQPLSAVAEGRLTLEEFTTHRNMVCQTSPPQTAPPACGFSPR